MPFKTGAKVTVTNETKTDLNAIFYDINFQILKNEDEDLQYFHCYWHRDTATTLGKDFEILPELKGKGRYLGCHIDMIGNPIYKYAWWGEGEVKVFLDGDNEFPTLVGTGAEDYTGTGYGLKRFVTRYSGCLIAEEKKRQYSFYRLHIPDPVYFENDCRVTIQQMGGWYKPDVQQLMKEKVKLIPTGIFYQAERNLLISDTSISVEKYKEDKGWVNFYRSDDFSATAYFYLDAPADSFPELQNYTVRSYKLK